jgi:hypothetical protein
MLYSAVSRLTTYFFSVFRPAFYFHHLGHYQVRIIKKLISLCHDRSSGLGPARQACNHNFESMCGTMPKYRLTCRSCQELQMPRPQVTHVMAISTDQRKTYPFHRIVKFDQLGMKTVRRIKRGVAVGTLKRPPTRYRPSSMPHLGLLDRVQRSAMSQSLSISAPESHIHNVRMQQLDVPIETSSTVHVLPPSSLLLDLSGAFDVALYFLVLYKGKPATSAPFATRRRPSKKP